MCKGLCVSISYTKMYIQQLHNEIFIMAKTAPINMRVEPRQHALLTKAAEVMNKDRSAFILEVACQEAENVLLDQRLFQLDDDVFAAFEVALDAPVPNNAKLKSLLASTSPWE
jgi:uncharacterized protein (DUF1778 family)